MASRHRRLLGALALGVGILLSTASVAAAQAPGGIALPSNVAPDVSAVAGGTGVSSSSTGQVPFNITLTTPATSINFARIMLVNYDEAGNITANNFGATVSGTTGTVNFTLPTGEVLGDYSAVEFLPGEDHARQVSSTTAIRSASGHCH